MRNRCPLYLSKQLCLLNLKTVFNERGDCLIHLRFYNNMLRVFSQSLLLHLLLRYVILSKSPFQCNSQDFTELHVVNTRLQSLPVEEASHEI